MYYSTILGLQLANALRCHKLSAQCPHARQANCLEQHMYAGKMSCIACKAAFSTCLDLKILLIPASIELSLHTVLQSAAKWHTSNS